MPIAASLRRSFYLKRSESARTFTAEKDNLDSSFYNFRNVNNFLGVRKPIENRLSKVPYLRTPCKSIFGCPKRTVFGRKTQVATNWKITFACRTEISRWTSPKIFIFTKWRFFLTLDFPMIYYLSNLLTSRQISNSKVQFLVAFLPKIYRRFSEFTQDESSIYHWAEASNANSIADSRRIVNY